MALQDGSKTVTTAGTRVKLSATSVIARWAIIQPLSTNTGKIYIGGPTVSSARGVEWSVGDSFVSWPGSYDLANIWIDAEVNGEGVKFLYDSPDSV